MKRMLGFVLPVMLVVPVFWISTRLNWFGSDWFWTYYPAARLLLHGQNPYLVPSFMNPPWALLPLLPFALFDPKMGLILFFAFNYAVFLIVARGMRAGTVATCLFVTSPLVIAALYDGNFDALVMLSFIMPAPLGLFLAVLKPQVGFGIILYWAWQAWKAGGPLQVARTFLPLALIAAVSILIWGRLAGDRPLLDAPWNASLWPWSIPLGLLLLYLGFRHGRQRPFIAASPLVSPYVGVGSWSVIPLAFLDNMKATAIIVGGLWIAVAALMP